MQLRPTRAALLPSRPHTRQLDCSPLLTRRAVVVLGLDRPSSMSYVHRRAGGLCFPIAYDVAECRNRSLAVGLRRYVRRIQKGGPRQDQGQPAEVGAAPGDWPGTPETCRRRGWQAGSSQWRQPSAGTHYPASPYGAYWYLGRAIPSGTIRSLTPLGPVRGCTMGYHHRHDLPNVRGQDRHILCARRQRHQSRLS